MTPAHTGTGQPARTSTRPDHRPSTATIDAGGIAAGADALQVPLAGLQPYYRNPRRGNVDAIATSLEANGQFRPVVVNAGTLTGRPTEVLAGNHTVAAARQLGWTSVAAVYVDVDDDRAARIVLADNRTSDLASYDTPELTGMLADLAGTFDGTGWDAPSAAGYLDPEGSAGADRPGASGYLPDDDDVDAMDGYTEQHGVIVLAADSGEQERIYQALRALNYRVRVVTT